MEQKHYHVIIAGAGSAGVPLATRLSESPHRQVLLLDAGPHFKTLAEYPEELRHGSLQRQSNPSHPNNWAFASQLTTWGTHQIVPRGRVVGGSSALNGTLFERGLPEDFNEWAEQGNDQWSFDRVLPFFKKLEKDLDIDNQWHGSEGPVPVRRPNRDEWFTQNHSFVEASIQAGFPEDPDKNDPKSIGVGPLPQNAVDGVRMNMAHNYLEPILDNRPNLTVRGNTYVRRVIFEGKRAVGVEVEQDGRTMVIYGDEIVLSAGAVKSPHILMLSGVGPGEQLRKFGIPVVYDNPNVGQNFTDHGGAGGVKYSYKMKGDYDLLELPGFHVGLHFTAEGSDVHSDMLALASSYPQNRQILYKTSLFSQAKMALNVMRTMSLRQVIDQARLGRRQSVGVLLMQGRSRGEMNLVSADPHARPHLLYHYLEDQFDVDRLRSSTRKMAEIVDSEPFQRIGAKRVSPTDDELATDGALDKYLYDHVSTAIHMASTCKMGPDSDDTAVTDQFCRVRGVEGLRVVDTSIWPQVVRRCTNATAVMTGERAAVFFE